MVNTGLETDFIRNAVYRCSECGKEFPVTPEFYLCPLCSKNASPNEPLRGILEVIYHLDDFKDKVQIPFPVEKEFFPSLPVGNTPLIKSVRLEKPNLYFKNDALNPTGSLKDRASLLVSAFAKKHEIRQIIVASTGNAASSMAGIGASAGQDIRIYVPDSAPQAKIAQSLIYGADVIKVNGNYDQAFETALADFRSKSPKEVICRNTAFNPLTIEGKKTVSFEIVQQLGKSPDYIFVPVGDGVILSGVYKGFEDMLEMGLIDKIPLVYSVQASGSSAINNAFLSGEFLSDYRANTLADSISVDIPRCGYLALRKLKKHQGRTINVSDEEILLAQSQLSATEGIFSEPAAATAFAGFLKVADTLDVQSVKVVLLTGHGLKDINSALKAVELSGRKK